MSSNHPKDKTLKTEWRDKVNYLLGEQSRQQAPISLLSAVWYFSRSASCQKPDPKVSAAIITNINWLSNIKYKGEPVVNRAPPQLCDCRGNAHLCLNNKYELMLMKHAKAYSSSCSQTVSISPVILSQLLWGYRSLMPLCTGFLEPRKSRLGPSKSTFNLENFVCSLSMSIFIGFGAIHSCNVSHSPKSPKNP